MKRVLVLVEGQTEETFVKGLLAPHLGERGIHISATCICTKRVAGRREHRGGIATSGKIFNDLRRLFASRPDAVTTIIDYYGLPPDFPGRDSLPQRANYTVRAEHLEQAFGREIDEGRFIPNIVMHEFEALLFSSPEVIAEVLLDEGIRAPLEKVASAFGCPEEINDSPSTAPSKRIADVHAAYRKPLHGPQIAGRIGLARIRDRCPRFNAWLSRLEQL